MYPVGQINSLLLTCKLNQIMTIKFKANKKERKQRTWKDFYVVSLKKKKEKQGKGKH